MEQRRSAGAGGGRLMPHSLLAQPSAAAARGGGTGLLSGSVSCESHLNSVPRPGSGPWPPRDVRLVSLHWRTAAGLARLVGGRGRRVTFYQYCLSVFALLIFVYFIFLHPWWRYRNTFLTLTLTTLSSNMTNCNIHFPYPPVAPSTLYCALSVNFDLFYVEISWNVNEYTAGGIRTIRECLSCQKCPNPLQRCPPWR